MANSGLSRGDVATIRAGHRQSCEIQAVNEDPRLNDVEDRIIELLKRGYTDEHIVSHHSLAEANNWLKIADVARMRYLCLNISAYSVAVP